MDKGRRKPSVQTENGEVLYQCANKGKCQHFNGCWQPVGNFYKSKFNPCGITSYCKDCSNAKTAKYKKENPEKVRETSMRSYRRKHPVSRFQPRTKTLADGTILRRCSAGEKCLSEHGCWQTPDNFGKRSRCEDGLSYYCHLCARYVGKKSRDKRIEAERVRWQEWYEKNKQSRSEYNKAWRAAHPDYHHNYYLKRKAKE